METRKHTRPGVLLWTAAPVSTSPTSSVLSDEDGWVDEVEEQAEREDDFFSQMDENGIIGLSEAMEDMELGESCADADSESDPNLYPGPLTPEEADPSGHEKEGSPEDVPRLPPCDDLVGSGTSAELGTVNDFTESCISKGEIKKMSHLFAKESARHSKHHTSPISQHALLVKHNPFPHLRHFTAEELASAPGIEAETFPEMSFTESLTESQRSHISPKSSPRHPEMKARVSLPPAAKFSEEVMSNHHRGISNEPCNHHKQPTASPRKTRQHSPGATNSAIPRSLKFKHQTTSPDREQRTPGARSTAAVDDSRKGPPLSYRTPDFSKVEPKVKFPKAGYVPPKSRRSPKKQSLSPEPPLVFKSPADIVKEVLLNTTDGSPAPSVSHRPQSRSPNTTVPQEFRCRQQATTLLEQLQEDYNRLLTKYAEAENTIDRLRLEAKDRALENQQSRPRPCQPCTDRAVNLYSDPPKPGHLVPSGLNQVASKILTLDFPQAQRADLNSASLHPNGHSNNQKDSPACLSPRSPGHQVGQQLASILYSQAEKFLQQLQTFEDLLKSKILKPFEQIRGVSQLAEGLDSLERGYLLARDEHKLLQQRGVEMGLFDPERELEGLIFQCGLCMDELKEQVDQMWQEEPTCDAPPSPPPPPTPSSVPSEGGETHPQSPPEPLWVDLGEAAVVEVSSASEESDEQLETEDEETLKPQYLKPPNGKHVENFANLMDHYQSFKELPKRSGQSHREAAALSATEEKGRQGTVKEQVQKSPERESDHLDSGIIKHPPSHKTSSQSTTVPLHPPSRRSRWKEGKSYSSSLSSLGDITALERRNSKLHTGSSRVLSQDGIVSPETDSGFVGSERSHLTPAAAPSPVHQRASESVPVPLENLGKPQTVQVSGPPASSQSNSVTVEPTGGAGLHNDQPRRSRRGHRRRTFSCSPQHWVSQTGDTRADSGNSDFGLESDSAHTVSEDGHTDHYKQYINSPCGSSLSSFSPAHCNREDHLTALNSSQAANHRNAIQKLQTEVTRLRETVESCVMHKPPLSSVRAAPPAQEYDTSQNTSALSVSQGRRDRQTVTEVQDSTLRRTARKRPPSTNRQKHQPDTCSVSFTSHPLVTRSTQTCTTAPDSHCSHTNTVCSSTRPRQQHGVSVQVSETSDEPDSRRSQPPLCPQCFWFPSATRQSPDGGNRDPSHSTCCRHCLLCERREPCRISESDCRRLSDSPKHTSCRQDQSPDGALRSRHFTAPTTPLHCTPVCAPPILLCTSPLYVSPSNSTGTSSAVQGGKKLRGRTRRSMSTDRDPSMDSSLDRAIRAARHMRNTSGHMARSLSSSLHYQELLSQSCIY